MTVRIMTGHVMDVLRQIEDESVHCVVTSPPYYGLRSYGTEPQVWGGDPNCQHEFAAAGKRHQVGRNDHGTGCPTSRLGPNKDGSPAGTEITPTRETAGAFCHCGAWRGDLGLEPTPELFIQHLVEVFREVCRVLRKDGTLWLNIGDSYGSGEIGRHDSKSFAYRAKADAAGPRQQQARPRGYKAKDLLMIPAQLALALRADGWWLRSEIVWAKKAPMPESCTDRPTCAHEKVFLLTKSARYFYDAIAVAEPADNGELFHGDYAGSGNVTQARNGRVASAPSRRANPAALCGPALIPEGDAAVGADNRAPHFRGRCHFGEAQITILGSMAWEAEDAEIVESVRFSIVMEEAERSFVMDLKPISRPADFATVTASLQRFASGNFPIRTTIVDAPAAIGRAGEADAVLTIPFPDADARAKPMLQACEMLADMIEKSRPAEVAFHCNELSQTLLVQGTFRPAHVRQSTKNTTQNQTSTRNLRNFWLLGPEPFPEAHFATFPTEIPRRAILAGTSAKGVCPKCGAPWVRVVEAAKYQPPPAEIGERNVDPSRGDKVRKLDGKSAEWREAVASRQTIGWRASCGCDIGAKQMQLAQNLGALLLGSDARVDTHGLGNPVPATVLDPFLGSGTTALVADQLGRDCIGIELSSQYAAMADRRLRDDAGMFASIAAE
jgi:DNA modification methylase